MSQFQAGYFLEAFSKSDLYKPLFETLTCFDVSNLDTKIQDFDAYCSVLNNILCRGLPTRPSIFIEQSFADAFGLTKRKQDELGAITFPLKSTETDFNDRLFKALHIIEPRLTHFRKDEEFDSVEEAKFIQEMLPNGLGNFWGQILERQRKITSVSNDTTNFQDQVTDFSLQIPYSESSLQGIVIEVDGGQHKVNPQLALDRQRDKYFADKHWKTYRLPTDKFFDFKNHIKEFSIIFKDAATHLPTKAFADLQNEELYLKNIKKNYDNKTFDKERLTDLQLALSPFAIARIQKVLLEYFLRHPEKCYNTEGVLRLAVIERDVPCAALAVADLAQQFDNLFALEGKGKQFTRIELDVFTTAEFEKAQLHTCKTPNVFTTAQFETAQLHTYKTPLYAYKTPQLIEKIDPSVFYDLAIDVAMLQRTGCTFLTENIQAAYKIEVRSAHHKASKRTFYTASHIEYCDLALRNDDGTFEDIEAAKPFLTYFLQNIFRKTAFRMGQLPILHRALKAQSVIGLLPTGGGKSLTYQIAALLQPGITLIIDPIKSLMKDQYDNLIKNKIDGCTYINSSLSPKEKRENVAKMANGETLFTFVSPERLQMRDFRTLLEDMYKHKIYFSYCVIDEAHCVSEWGHDFRTSYLRLGANVLNFCKTKNNHPVPLFGLTATASFDVLADVQRELSGTNEASRLNESAVVRFETFNRTELNFEIVKVEANLTEIAEDNEWRIKESIGAAKQNKILSLLDKCGNDILNVSENSQNGHKRLGFQPQNVLNPDCAIGGIVFAPHRRWFFGVTDEKGNGIKNRIEAAKPDIKIGYFMGSSDDIRADIIDKESTKNQTEFIDNKLQLLVATKAFGMGIDKPNVGYTIHFNYPNSIESFVQESGRAGRDRKASMCYLLFNDQTVLTKHGEKREVDKDVLLFFHHNSFKGQDKEILMLREMLESITHAPKSNVYDLNQRLIDQYGYEHIQLNYSSKDQKIYVKENFGTYGYFKIPSFDITPYFKDFDGTLARQVLEDIKPKLKILLSTVGHIPAWLDKKEAAVPPIEGIEKRLNGVKIGAAIEPIAIYFRGDDSGVIDSIWNIFEENGLDTKSPFTKKNLNESISNSFEIFDSNYKNHCVSPLTLTDIITRNFNRRGMSERTESVLSQIKEQINILRDEQDTYKAVYRLSILGIVDDYEVDYNANTLTLYITKKDDSLDFDLEKVNEPKYINHLFRYLNQYNSQTKVIKDLKTIREPKYNAPTNSQRMMKFLLHFVYEQIAKKRLRGIDDMRLACQIGLNENGGQELKDFIDLYFNSKYARPKYHIDDENYSLRVDTEGDTIDDLLLIEKYIHATEIDKGGEKDNLKHLRGASLLLMRDINNAERATLHLLQAYTLFILEYKNEKLLAEAQTSYLKGFVNLYNTEGYQHLKPEEFVEYILAFNQKIRSKFEDTRRIDDILNELVHTFYLKIHTTWLKNFNEKHL